MKKYLLTSILFFVYTTVYSQLTIDSLGKVGVGNQGSSNGKISFYPSTSTSCFFHIDNRSDCKLHISHGTNVGDADLLTIGNDANLVLGNASTVSGKISLLPSGGNTRFHIDNRNDNTLRISMGNYPGNLDLLTINTPGNYGHVGIGTTTPGTLLGGMSFNYGKVFQIVAPSAGLQDAVLVISARGSRYGRIIMENALGTAGKRGFEFIHLDEKLNLRVLNESDGTSSMDPVISFATSGSIGIGSAPNPTYKLTVNGTVNAGGYYRNGSSWPDYVFEDNHKLIPITELEKFVKRTKHLPNIPSADEIAQTGFELGDMQIKLVQKVEELTLYIFELKKENDSLKERMLNIEKSK